MVLPYAVHPKSQPDGHRGYFKEGLELDWTQLCPLQIIGGVEWGMLEPVAKKLR